MNIRIYCIYVCTYVRMYTSITCTYAHTHINTHAYTHIRILHTHIHTNMYTHMVHTSYNLNVTCVYHACVDHELHMQFCCKRVTSCVGSSEPWTHEKTHELHVHVYVHVSFHTHVYICYTRTQYNLCTEVQHSLTKYTFSVINLQFVNVLTTQADLHASH